MGVLISILAGLMVAGAVYMMLDRNLVKYLFGLILLSNAANLILFNAGRLTEGRPAFIAAGAVKAPHYIANALPQALILTAIVIGFGLLAFSMVLAYRAYQEIGSIDLDRLGFGHRDENHIENNEVSSAQKNDQHRKGQLNHTD